MSARRHLLLLFLFSLSLPGGDEALDFPPPDAIFGCDLVLKAKGTQTTVVVVGSQFLIRKVESQMQGRLEETRFFPPVKVQGLSSITVIPVGVSLPLIYVVDIGSWKYNSILENLEVLKNIAHPAAIVFLDREENNTEDNEVRPLLSFMGGVSDFIYTHSDREIPLHLSYRLERLIYRILKN